MKLKDEQLITLNGGTLSAAFLNAAARAINTILEVGRTVGSAIRRLYSRNYC